MADLAIKPTTGSGNKVIIQDQAGGAVLTTADSGATIANATLTSPTLNSPTLVTPALGTPASGVMTNMTFPAGTITGYTTTITTPSATQGSHTNNATMTGSSISYTPTTGASFVVYEYSAYLMGGNVYSLQLMHFKKNGSLVNGTNWQMNYRTDGSFTEFSGGQVHFKYVMPAWSGAQTLDIQYQQWETSGGYQGRWHSSTYSGNDTGTDVWVDIYRTTYSVM